MDYWFMCSRENIIFNVFEKVCWKIFPFSPGFICFFTPIIFFFFIFANWAYTWEIVLFSYGGKNMMSHSYFSFTEKGLDVPDLMTIIMAHPVLLKFDTALVGLDPESRTLNWTTKNNLGGIYRGGGGHLPGPSLGSKRFNSLLFGKRVILNDICNALKNPIFCSNALNLLMRALALALLAI